MPQFLYGDPSPVMAEFDTSDATVTFDAGDIVLQASSDGYVSRNGASDTVTTNFLGISAQRKPAGTTGTALRLFGNSTDGRMRVDTGGVFEFARSDTIALNVGDPVGPDGTTINVLKKVGDASISIGRVAEPVDTGSANNRVKVRILSRKQPAAYQA